MTEPPADQTILRLRTHPKILVGPVLAELVLIVAHVLVAQHWHLLTGWGWQAFDRWSALVVHGFLAVLGLAWAVVPTLRWWAGTFILTTTAVSQHWGIIMRRSRSIQLDQIVTVDTERGLLDRIFGCGTLIFQDASAQPSSPDGAIMTRPGGRGSGIRFHDVPKVQEVLAAIQKARGAA